LSFWDSLIVEAALTANVRELYSEDMHDGRVINGMRITNPFKTGSRI
jgi:predicted nucleic acid-binding protein